MPARGRLRFSLGVVDAVFMDAVHERTRTSLCGAHSRTPRGRWSFDVPLRAAGAVIAAPHAVLGGPVFSLEPCSVWNTMPGQDC